ncbi:MAG: sugar ABC transporter permease [Chloroflexi bacterium]|nr:MAG: sugar ABC transporter permease [Chloroflexota bacterium]
MQQSTPTTGAGLQPLAARDRTGLLSQLRDSFTGLRREETIAGYLFILPNFLGFLAFSLLPIGFALYITFTDWSLARPPVFIGLENFRTLFNDPLFWKTLWNTAYYTFVAVPTGVFIAFWLAILMNRKMRGVLFFRTVYFLPQITLTVAAAIVWSWLYHPELGLFNYLLGLIGVEGPRWLQSTAWAMPAIIIMGNWHGIGFAMLILLAGLQGIPEEYYEAAEIDGANGWQRLRFVTIPLLTPTIFFVVVTSLIGAFQGFDQFYVMTNGGPAKATTTLVLYIFQNGFTFFKMGYGAALAFMLFLCILVITLVQWRLADRWVYGFQREEN